MVTPRRPPVFEQFFATRRFQQTLAFTADSTAVLFSCNISGQFNLWQVPAAGGWPVQLTTFDDRSVRGVAPSPDGALIVFSADRDGDEAHQLYALDTAGGWPVAWTDAPQVQHELRAGTWDPPGRRLAYAANARRRTDMDVWVRDIGTGAVTHVFGDGRYCLPVSFSPDGKHLLCVEARGNDDLRPHLVDPDGAGARALLAQPEPARSAPGPWAPDGSGFWLATDLGRDVSGLAFLDINRDRLEWVRTPDWDVEDIAADPAGTVLVWIENEDGWGRLRGRDLRTDTPLPAVDLPPGCGTWAGTALTVSPDGQLAALLWLQPDRAQELYVVELSTGRSRRLTGNMLGGLAPDQLTRPALVRYDSVDDLRVPAWVYRPDRPGRRPVVLSIHGGPEMQERPEYRPLYQYLCSRGIGVLAPNIRGSRGYGKGYQRLIHRDWGGGDLADLRHAVKWLRGQDWVDPERIGVFGSSYGGFATLSCLTRLPDHWAAGVDIFGPSDLVSFTGSVQPAWRRLVAAWIGDPEADAEILRARSPISYVDDLAAPLLVIQGANDPRVVRGESDQMVQRLREVGRDVEYVVFPDEGHGFTRHANELRAARLTADWFTRHLLDDG